MNRPRLPTPSPARVTQLWTAGLLLGLSAGLCRADYFDTPGPWEGFPRTQPTARYESDVGAKPDYPFGVTKAFSPYKDPDRAEADGLANPLENPDFDSYKLIVIVNKKADPFWGHAQTLRVYKRDVGLLYYWLISSGAKGFETASGYFRPQFFSSRHWSSKYDAPMLWAVFFHGGMALHSSLDRVSLTELGQAAASHGCVHVEDYRAEELFHLVGHSGFGPVDVIDRHTGRKTGRKAQSYQTLIIVGPTGRWGQKTAAGAGAKSRTKPAVKPVRLRNLPPEQAKLRH